MTLEDHITKNLFMAPEDQAPPPSEADYGSRSGAQVARELDWVATTTAERSRRHGLCDVADALTVLTLRQQLAHMTALQSYIGAANHALMERGESPNAHVDLEPANLAAHPLPPEAQDRLDALTGRYRTPRR